MIKQHPLLANGQILDAGTVLLQIDPTEYQLAVDRAQAELIQIRLAQTSAAQEHTHLKADLKLQKQRLALYQSEQTRQQNLQRKNLSSRTELEAAQQAFLAQQSQVNALENRLATLPNDIAKLEADELVANTALTQAKLNLDKTELVMPFRGRIANLSMTENQQVTKHKQLLTVYGLDNVEVDIQLPVFALQRVVDVFSFLQKSNSQMLAALRAEVIFSSGDVSQAFSAKVLRMTDSANLTQATLGVILQVMPPENSPLQLPGLLNGMFVQANIYAPEQTVWAIPEYALRGDKIYLLEQGGLKILPVAVKYRQDGLAIIEGDLKVGQQVILNDLIPAVAGMPLSAASPVPDAALEATP